MNILSELYFLRNKDFLSWYAQMKHRITFDGNWDMSFKNVLIPKYVPAGLKYQWADLVNFGFSFCDSEILKDGFNLVSTTIANGMSRADEYCLWFPQEYDYLTEQVSNYPGQIKPTSSFVDWLDAIEDGKLAATKQTKLLLMGSFGRPDEQPKNTPDYLVANWARLKSMPFDAYTVYLRAGKQNYSEGLCRKIFAGQKTNSQDYLDALKPLKSLAQERELFVEMISCTAPQVYDDAGWRVVYGNLQRLAAACSVNDIKGILIDDENYGNRGDKTKSWTYYAKPDLDAARVKAFERGQQCRAAIGSNLEVLTMLPPIWALSEHQSAIDGGLQLHGAFIVGMVTN